MKKMIMVLMLAITFGGSIYADRYLHSDADLPVAAKAVLSKNFKSGVSLVKVDREFGRIDEFEVILKDGSEVTFDSKGNWKNVEVSTNKSVPEAFILKPIRDYVNKNHPRQNIVGIEKNRNNIEVTLSNNVEMKFDNAGKFLKYDD